MSDYDDYDDDYDHGEDNWIYVEDHYDEAVSLAGQSFGHASIRSTKPEVEQDELAEYTCPSPTWQALEADSYDPYDYFEDLAYLSDSYYDRQGENHVDGKKRKRTQIPEQTASGLKRKRRSGVVWKADAELFGDVENAPLVRAGEKKPYALLKDWRERFQTSPGFAVGKLAPTLIERDQEQPLLKGEGFDPGDLRSVASMLSGDALENLKELLSARGLDSDAVQAVMEDLASGKEPEFSSDGEDNDVLREATTTRETPAITPGAMSEDHASIPHRSLKRKQSYDVHDENEVTSASKRRQETRSEIDATGQAGMIQQAPEELLPSSRHYKRKASVDVSSVGVETPNTKSRRINESVDGEAPCKARSPRIAARHVDDAEPKRKATCESKAGAMKAKRVTTKVKSLASGIKASNNSSTHKRSTRSLRSQKKNA